MDHIDAKSPGLSEIGIVFVNCVFFSLVPTLRVVTLFPPVSGLDNL
jgi:hypothetical protein